MKLQYVNNSDNEQPLWKKHHEDAGWDIRSNVDISIKPGETAIVPTGVHVAIPEGYYGQIADRSGLAVQGLSARGGVIDAGYRDEIKVILHNETPFNHIRIDEETGIELVDLIEPNTFEIKKGERIAQFIILPVVLDEFIEVDALDETERGMNGLGSSGIE